MVTPEIDEPEGPTAKVLFRVTMEDGSCEVETLWAFALGADRYRIDNCPFYAYGVSLADVVFAPFDSQEQFPTFRQVLHKSGNRTLRIVLNEQTNPASESRKVLEGITHLGCGYEGADKRYFAINVPPSTQLAAITTFLNAEGVEWEHADPSYDDLYPDSAG